MKTNNAAGLGLFWAVVFFLAASIIPFSPLVALHHGAGASAHGRVFVLHNLDVRPALLASPDAVDVGDLTQHDGSPDFMRLAADVYEGVRTGNLWAAVAPCLVMALWAVRKYGAARFPWLGTRRGGALMTLGLALAGGLCNAALAGAMTAGTLLDAIKVALIAAGGWVLVRNLAGEEPPTVDAVNARILANAAKAGGSPAVLGPGAVSTAGHS